MSESAGIQFLLCLDIHSEFHFRKPFGDKYYSPVGYHECVSWSVTQPTFAVFRCLFVHHLPLPWPGLFPFVTTKSVNQPASISSATISSTKIMFLALSLFLPQDPNRAMAVRNPYKVPLAWRRCISAFEPKVHTITTHTHIHTNK